MNKLHCYYLCELCNKNVLTTQDFTICDACDEQLKIDQQGFIPTPKERHCRRCFDVLEVTRYFHCTSCLPQARIENLSEDFLEFAHENVFTMKEKLDVGKKRCSKCKYIKNIKDDFYIRSLNNESYRSECKACSVVYSKKSNKNKSVQNEHC